MRLRPVRLRPSFLTRSVLLAAVALLWPKPALALPNPLVFVFVLDLLLQGVGLRGVAYR